jgi:hypothetical protein
LPVVRDSARWLFLYQAADHPDRNAYHYQGSDASAHFKKKMSTAPGTEVLAQKKAPLAAELQSARDRSPEPPAAMPTARSPGKPRSPPFGLAHGGFRGRALRPDPESGAEKIQCVPFRAHNASTIFLMFEALIQIDLLVPRLRRKGSEREGWREMVIERIAAGI